MGISLVELIIFKCEDQRGDAWELVHPDDVPLAIKEDEEVIEFLESGHVATLPGETTIYAGIKYGSGGNLTEASKAVMRANNAH